MATSLRRLALLTSAIVLLAACGPSSLDVAAVEGGSAPDGGFPEVDWPDAAAWMADEVAETGQPLVVKFWASWCGPCREEAPVMLAAMGRSPDISWVGVDHQDVRTDATEFAAETGLDEMPHLFDPMGEVARALGARGMPAVSFVRADGTLAGTHTGPITTELLDAWLAHLRGEAPRPAVTSPDDAVPLE